MPPNREFRLLIALVVILTAMQLCNPMQTVNNLHNDLYTWENRLPLGLPDAPVEPGPGNNVPGGSQAQPGDPTAVLGSAPTQVPGGNSFGPLKPVCFLNTGTSGATVMAWTYIPLNSTSQAASSSASTVAAPGGNTSACLSLPLGTYTWCYHWELGDVNQDGMIEYAHALDGRHVILDESDTDDLDLAEKVNIVAPTLIGDITGRCGAAPAPTTLGPARSQLENGDKIFSDNGGGAEGMFGPEYMSFGYQDGQAHLTANSNNLVLPAMYGGFQANNFIAEVDFSSFSTQIGSQYGIIFRSDDVPGGLSSYYITSVLPGSRTVEFALWLDNAWVLSSSSVISDDSISVEPPLHFRLEANGNQYAVFLNGHFAAVFTDGTLTSPGIIGISIITENSPDALIFKNLNIYSIP